MITINATGDTTLHTAGKYCAEDILVKVPAGGNSGAALENISFHCSIDTGAPHNTIDQVIYHTVSDDGTIQVAWDWPGEYQLDKTFQVAKNTTIAFFYIDFVYFDKCTTTGDATVIRRYMTTHVVDVGDVDGSFTMVGDDM